MRKFEQGAEWKTSTTTISSNFKHYFFYFSAIVREKRVAFYSFSKIYSFIKVTIALTAQL